MRHFFTVLFSVLVASSAMAQAPTGVFAKASSAPVIDGVVDAVWSEATVYNIDRKVGTQTPTIGLPGETTWQGLWTKDGVYILLKVTDNAFYPNYIAGAGFNDYDYDKAELYFDLNYNLADTKGPSTANSGHIQIAPGFALDKTDGTAIDDNGVIHAFMVTGSNYIAEYFVPLSKLTDSDGFQVDKTSTIGFDVNIIDRDPGDLARNQGVWSNQGALGESWTDMDDAGHVTFQNGEANIMIESITMADGTITTDGGTLQMVATISPVDATVQTLKWTVENGTGSAKISAAGLVTGTTNGTVTVKATSTDGSWSEISTVVTITGQQINPDDIWNSFNLISNWSFDDATIVAGWPIGWSGWNDSGNMGGTPVNAVVEESVAVMQTGIATDGQQWHYQFNISGFTAESNVAYTFKFKSWSSNDRANAVDFEDTGANGNNRYGISTDPEAITVGSGSSEWHYNTTSEPTWFIFHVTFDRIIPSTVQKINYMYSQAEGTVYLDSVLLVKDAQLISSAKQLTDNSKSLRVYPSPMNNMNQLTVELSSLNAKVAIYNSLGQKMMEKVATGAIVKFNVSSLTKGIYFVRLSDGTSQKFIR